MPTIEVAVVRRETARAVQLIFWDERLGWHRVLWCPKSLIRTPCTAGDRAVTLEVSASLAMLPDWAWLAEDEQDEYRAFLKQMEE